ncbi:MAG: response regulator [Nitrospirota bacterium]|nr:response regulator [Nitrospirota bacterium]
MTTPKILVVEDEGLIAMEISDRLRKLGYTVTDTVATGEEALAGTTRTKPDLVLMDIMLAGAVDGIETAARIRDRLEVPVVYLTAYADNATLARAQVTEPYGYVLKPFQERELKAAVEIALYKSRMEQERKKLINDLQSALAEVRTLRGIIHICPSCRRVRLDDNSWQRIEQYVQERTDAVFNNGICDTCGNGAASGEDRR